MSDGNDLSHLDLAGKIVIGEQVTWGGFSDISQGTLLQDDVQIRVAIKCLRFHGASGIEAAERLRKRFFREILLWRRLQNRNVVPLLGYTMPLNGSPTMVSPWYIGGNVIQYLRSCSNSDRRALITDVINGLAYLHSILVVHGDLKGENVLVDSNGRASLCDFGMSQFIDEATHIAGYTTTNAGMGGTDRFMCPKLWNGDPKTTASDVWAVGCLIVQILIDQMPYHHLITKPAVFSAIMRGEMPWMTRSSEIDTSLWECIKKCWNITPDERPPVSELGIYFLPLENTGTAASVMNVDFGDITMQNRDSSGNSTVIGNPDDENCDYRRWQRNIPRHLTFPAHGSSVITCLLLSHHRIISASDDHSIHMHSTDNGELIRSFLGHEAGVWALELCSRHQKPLSSGPTPMHSSPPTVPLKAYYHDTLVSGSTDQTARIWDVETGRNTHVFRGHTSTVRCIAIARPVWIDTEDGSSRKVKWPKKTMFVTGSRDHTIRVWRLPAPGDSEYPGLATSSQGDPEDEDVNDNPYHIMALTGHTHVVKSLAVHGRTLVSGSYDTTVRVWDLITGYCKYLLRGHDQKVYSVVIDHMRNQTCSGSMDGTVRIWSLQNGSQLHTLSGHTSLIGLLSISPTNLVSASADSTLRIWDPTTGSLRQILSGHRGAITCVQHDEFKVISGSDGELKMWDTRDGSVRDLLTGVTGVWQVVFDRRICVAATYQQDLTYLEVLDFAGEDEMESASFEDERGDDHSSDAGDLDVEPQ